MERIHYGLNSNTYQLQCWGEIKKKKIYNVIRQLKAEKRGIRDRLSIFELNILG